MKENNQIDNDNSILVSDEWYQLYTMQREDNVKLAKKLLRIQLDHDIKITKIGEALGANVDIFEILPLDLVDIACDLIGVPADNGDEYSCESKEYYSRDWIWDNWLKYDINEDREEHIDWYINIMTEHTLEYRRVNANW